MCWTPTAVVSTKPRRATPWVRGLAVGIVWAWRDQGMILPAGNPRRLARVEDLVAGDIRVIGRQPRAGSHVLMVHLLTEAGLRLDQISLLPGPAMAEDEVAAAVAEGRADAGFGILAEAARRGLDFVPLLRERFDLVMGLRSYFELRLPGPAPFRAGRGLPAPRRRDGRLRHRRGRARGLLL